MTMPDKKRKKKKELAAEAPAPEARLVRVRLGNKKSSSSKGAASPDKSSVYMVLAHGAEKDPSHSVVEVTAGAAVRRLLYISGGMSFTAMGTPYGPRIVGVGLEEATIYDPKTSTELAGPRLAYAKLNPVLIADGGKLYALSRSPAVVMGLDFVPWFLVLDSIDYSIWSHLPPPPIFPCRLNPLEYRDPPKVRVAAYAIVDSHILLSVQQDNKGTCAFDMHAQQWDMVHDKNLPFTGQAVPLGDHHFVACSKENGGAAAVYYMVVGISVTGKKELSILELHGAYKRGNIPGGHLLCAMGKGSFSSFTVRSVASPTKQDRARIVHRTYSLLENEDDDDAQTGLGSGVMVKKQDRQIYKLRDPHAYSSWAVAVLTMENDQSPF